MLVKYFYPWGFFHPIQSGADTVAADHLEYFRDRGWDVELITVRLNGYARDEAAFRARYPWVKVAGVYDLTPAPFTLGDQLLAYAELADRADVRAAFARPADLFVTSYTFTAPLAPLVPAGVPKLLETIDIISDQLRIDSLDHPRRPNDRAPGLLARQRQYLFGAELDLYRLFDAVAMITREELDAVTRAGATNAHYVPRYAAKGEPAGTDAEPRHDLLFVGSKFRPNLDGMNWFYRNVYVPYLWPRGMRLAVAGQIGEWLDFADRGVTLLGTVAGPLDPVYAASKVVVAPVFEGTGISIKAVEALSMGKALVAAPAAARGIDADSGALVVSDMKADPRAAADVLLELIDNPARRQTLERAAVAYVRREFGRDAFFDGMDRAVRAAGLNPTAARRAA